MEPQTKLTINSAETNSQMLNLQLINGTLAYFKALEGFVATVSPAGLGPAAIGG